MWPAASQAWALAAVIAPQLIERRNRVFMEWNKCEAARWRHPRHLPVTGVFVIIPELLLGVRADSGRPARQPTRFVAFSRRVAHPAREHRGGALRKRAHVATLRHVREHLEQPPTLA